MIGKLQEQHTSFEVAERAAASGDQLKIDFNGTFGWRARESVRGKTSPLK